MTGRHLRNAEQTRRELIEAAVSVLSTQGPAASLAAIAAVAGVSKGGLLHHFPTRDGLLMAVVTFQADQFREAVEAALDPDDNAPGRLTRAFVRAVFADIAGNQGRAHEQALLLGALGGQPGFMELTAADSAEWTARLEADGLDEQRISLILRAADGTSIAALYDGAFTAADAATTQAWLLELTYGTGPLR